MIEIDRKTCRADSIHPYFSKYPGDINALSRALKDPHREDLDGLTTRLVGAICRDSMYPFVQEIFKRRHDAKPATLHNRRQVALFFRLYIGSNIHDDHPFGNLSVTKVPFTPSAAIWVKEGQLGEMVWIACTNSFSRLEDKMRRYWETIEQYGNLIDNSSQLLIVLPGDNKILDHPERFFATEDDLPVSHRKKLEIRDKFKKAHKDALGSLGRIVPITENVVLLGNPRVRMWDIHQEVEGILEACRQTSVDQSTS